jgi:hypothetical protein
MQPLDIFEEVASYQQGDCMTKIVSIDPKGKRDAQHKQDLLDVLEEMREQIEAGEITDFVAVSILDDGDTQIHVMIDNLPSAVGLYEIGKHMVIQQIAYGVGDE